MERLSINKTYKLFINGAFIRSESGQTYPVLNDKKECIANVCSASRKDFKNAVVVARQAELKWSSKTAFNRSQVLYRLAEMLESRKEGFIVELQLQGLSKVKGTEEVNRSIDRLVYYAGWCDKYGAVFSSVNPISGSFFNYSMHEAMGVIAGIAPESNPLLGLVSIIAPVLAGGNSIILLASEQKALSAISFAEVVQNSDVPSGVINILTGSGSELWPNFASHMDVNAVLLARQGLLGEGLSAITANIKRYRDWTHNWDRQDPYTILDFQEVKTIWHPIERSADSTKGY